MLSSSRIGGVSLILRYTPPFASLSCACFTTCHCSLVLAAGCGGNKAVPAGDGKERQATSLAPATRSATRTMGDGLPPFREGSSLADLGVPTEAADLPKNDLWTGVLYLTGCQGWLYTSGRFRFTIQQLG